jgi:sulfate adenylyltransferase
VPFFLIQEREMPRKDKIISPYGGKLVNLIVSGDEREQLIAESSLYPSIKISQRSVHDLELLATGGFSPLDRFMGRADYQRVLTEMRLADGTLFPIPITLTIGRDEIPARADWLALRDAHNNLLAVMRVEEFYNWDPNMEARLVYSSTDHRHPMVSEMIRWGDFCVSGEIKVLSLPKYHDFVELRHTPAQVRAKLEAMGNKDVVAFQTRNPMHRIHEELTNRAAEAVERHSSHRSRPSPCIPLSRNSTRRSNGPRRASTSATR